MKQIYTILVAVLLTASVFAQTPEKMTYQAIVRDASDNLITNTNVGMQISILQTSATGTAVYVETQTPTTNTNGLVTIEIGTGTVISGNFSTIDWANDSYFIKTETDLNGGANYTIIGTSQLLSVPYALHAKTAESITGGTSLAIGDSYGGGIIFWLDSSGQHGLIAATADQDTGIQWYNGSYITTGATLSAVYAGMSNTNKIIASQGVGSYAAQVCADYNVTVNNEYYDDWYLPSITELNLLYYQKTVVGGFDSSTFYWSSTENGGTSSFVEEFDGGFAASAGKNNVYSVRAVRAF